MDNTARTAARCDRTRGCVRSRAAAAAVSSEPLLMLPSPDALSDGVPEGVPDEDIECVVSGIGSPGAVPAAAAAGPAATGCAGGNLGGGCSVSEDRVCDMATALGVGVAGAPEDSDSAPTEAAGTGSVSGNGARRLLDACGWPRELM